MPTEQDGITCPCCIWRKQFSPHYNGEPCDCHFVDMAEQLDKLKQMAGVPLVANPIADLPIMHCEDEPEATGFVDNKPSIFADDTAEPHTHACNCLPDYTGEDMILRVNVRSNDGKIDSDFEIESASENEMLQTLGLLTTIQQKILQSIYKKHNFTLKFGEVSKQ